MIDRVPGPCYVPPDLRTRPWHFAFPASRARWKAMFRATPVRFRTRGIVAALGAVAASVVLVAPASAAATITRETITSPIFVTGLPDECRPGLTGTLNGTNVLDYQLVETKRGYHIISTETDTGRITWSDGSYAVIESVDHHSNNVGTGTREFTTAHVDSANTYAADGTFLYRMTLHVIEHRTIVNGVVKVEFDKRRFHTFGVC